VAVGVLVVVAASSARAQVEPPPELIVRYPYLQLLFDTSVEIRWTTSDDVVGAVRYARGDEPFREVTGPIKVEHRIRLEGLEPATQYRYEVLCDGEVVLSGNDFRFRTAPPTGQGEFRAVVIGDSGIGTENQYLVAEVVESIGADIFLHTGDLIYRGTVDDAIFMPYRPTLSKTCLFPTRGNHDDLIEWQGYAWRELFGVPEDEPGRPGMYCAYDWGPARFVVLDYYSSERDDALQLEFAETEFRAARERDVRWLIAYLHVPPFTTGSHSNWRTLARERLPVLCDRYQVDLVMSGHDHNYQRTWPVREGVVRDGWQDPEFVRPRGTVYVVTGGGGAFLYRHWDGSPDEPVMHTFHSVLHAVQLDVSESRLRLQAITTTGSVIDDFSLVKEGERPPFTIRPGDPNGDGIVDIADVIATLRYLFSGPGEGRFCPAAARTGSADRPLSIGDGLRLLRFLFAGEAPPPAPFPDCGEVDVARDAGCQVTGC